MKIETAKLEIKKGDEVLVKRINLKGKILDYFKDETQTILEIKLENGIVSYFFLVDIEKVINSNQLN